MSTGVKVLSSKTSVLVPFVCQGFGDMVRISSIFKPQISCFGSKSGICFMVFSSSSDSSTKTCKAHRRLYLRRYDDNLSYHWTLLVNRAIPSSLLFIRRGGKLNPASLTAFDTSFYRHNRSFLSAFFGEPLFLQSLLDSLSPPLPRHTRPPN